MKESKHGLKQNSKIRREVYSRTNCLEMDFCFGLLKL